ncbi:MAG: sigma-70 family RNA polymerase sigma factor [Acidobacteria bacterium]|nr:MAG: sigma-70 family RNA polymerase sigma factor [Acidobacteriota bacterium]
MFREQYEMDLDERELILEAQKGEGAAFEELVYRYDRKILKLAFSYTKDEEDAKDVYQEVFIRVFRALPGFRFDSRFSTWLYRIAVNVCLSYKSRAQNREHESLDMDDEQGSGRSFDPVSPDLPSDQKALGSEISQHVRAALEALSPQQRLVFTLRHYEGYKLKEIAALMNCAEGTVKKYLFTATERLRHQLRPVFQ